MLLIQVSCCCDFIIRSRALLSTFQLTTYIAACSSEVEHSPIIVPLLFYQVYFSYCRKSGISTALQLMFDLQSRHVVLVTCNSTTSFNLRLPGRAWCPGVPPICCTIISFLLGYIGDSLCNSLTQS